MKKHALPLLLASLLLAFSSMSFAEEQQGYGSKVGNKALNGFANMTTGILEIPKNIINESNESNVIWGFLGGGIKGILNTIGRLAVGVADLITAPLPTNPIVHPVYVWDDFDVDTSYGEVFRLEGEEPRQSGLHRPENKFKNRY
jgi:putative exosortase-associated protein (TIGR04073 family)